MKKFTTLSEEWVIKYMETLKPEELFFNTLVKLTSKHFEEVKNASNYRQGALTKIILGKGKSDYGILGNVLKSIDSTFELEKEYFRLDMIAWQQLKEELRNSTSLNSYMWDLRVAVEHENNPKKWLDEVAKIAFINCPLRVVIGYYDKKLDEELDIIKTIFDREHAFAGDSQVIMLILGKKSLTDDPNNRCGYEKYVFTKHGLVVS